MHSQKRRKGTITIWTVVDFIMVEHAKNLPVSKKEREMYKAYEERTKNF